MDTMWFAVDNDGHVALFDSGEAGAVPDEANLGEDFWPLLEELSSIAARSEVRYAYEALLVDGEPSHTQVYDRPMPALVFLERDDAVRDALEAGQARRVQTTWGVGVVFDQLDKVTYDQLHEAGACFGCCFYAEDEEYQPNVTALGLFRYGHSAENWAAGAYVLEAQPDSPVKAQDLPTSVRQCAIRFDGAFGSTPRLQPAELWASSAWSAGYLSLDGKTMRPFPGREQEYAEEVAQVKEQGFDDGITYLDVPELRKPWHKRWFS